MRRLVWIVGLSLALSGCFLDYQWSKFTDPAHTFTVEVPRAPTVKNVAAGTDDHNKYARAEYLVDLGPSALLVMIGDHRGLHEDPDTAIASSVQALRAQAASGFSERPVTIDGHAGTLATWTTAKDETVSDRVFFVDARRFQVMTVLPKDASPAELATTERFVRSFHFLP